MRQFWKRKTKEVEVSVPHQTALRDTPARSATTGGVRSFIAHHAGNAGGKIVSKAITSALSSTGASKTILHGITAVAGSHIAGRVALGAARGAINEIPGGETAINLIGLSANKKNEQKKPKTAFKVIAIGVICFIAGIIVGRT